MSNVEQALNKTLLAMDKEFPIGEQLYKALEKSLIDIQEKRDDLVTKLRQSTELCLSYMSKLKEELLSNSLANEEEEVFFFKHTKPKFHKLLIFNSEAYKIEISRPIGDKLKLQEYYQTELQKLLLFFESQYEMYMYYRTNATYRDYEYFTRKNNHADIIYNYNYFDRDHTFTTREDYTIGKILANELLSEFLIERSKDIEQNNFLPSIKLSKKLHYKGKKVTVVEWVYANKEAGYFDEPIEEIFECLEDAFSIQFSNPSRIYQEIIARQAGDAVGLQFLAKKLTERNERINAKYKSKK